MMKRSVSVSAILAALAIATGCGGGSSSGDSSHPRPESAAAALDRLGERVQQATAPRGSPARKAEPEERGAGQEGSGVQLPQGVPLDTRSSRVRKAIADLLHPRKHSRQDGEKAPSRKGSVLGILEQLRRAAREKIGRVPRKGRDHSGDEGGSSILDMLR